MQRSFRSSNVLLKVIGGRPTRLLDQQPQLRFFHASLNQPQQNEKKEETTEEKKEETKEEKKEEEENVEEPVRKVNKRYIEWAFNIAALGLFTLGGIKAYQYFSEKRDSPIDIIQQNINQLLGKKDPTTERLLTEVTGPMKPVLVLPLEDFLIHQPYNSGNLAKRPNASEFLQAASKFYEVVIISESNKDTVEPIINVLDPQNLTARVYRESLADKNGVLVKDIARLNRPLDNVITMEPYPETAKQYADNSLIVKRWNGDKKDRFFTEAIVFLEYLASKDSQHVQKQLLEFTSDSQEKNGEKIIHDFYVTVLNSIQKPQVEQPKSGGFWGLFGWK